MADTREGMTQSPHREPAKGRARPSDQALAVPATPLRVDGPSGFDPSRWSLDYIEDAACARITYTWKGREYPGNSNYDPVSTGVHLCGQTDDGEQPTTVANYPMSKAEVRTLFEAAKVAECPKDEADFLADLMIDDQCFADFWTNRQLWPRAIEAWNAIATEARRAATGNTDAVHEGAGPKDIAQ